VRLPTHARGHVLVARQDNDGDVLLAGPAVRAVAASAARVTLLCGPRGRQAAGLLPGVDEVRCWRAPWIDPEPEPVDRADVDALVGLLGGLRLDAAVILTSFHQSALPLALLLRLAGVPWIGAISDDYPGSLLDVRHRLPDDLPEAERALSLAQACGFALPPGDAGGLAVALDPAERPHDLDGAPYFVVHPGASVPARAWGPDRCRELVGLLVARGHRVLVTGAPAERELCGHVAAGGGEDWGGRTSLAGLGHVLAGARVVVVGNTGPAHLAAAVGTPVASLFAPTVPAIRWAPYGVPHALLHVEVPCAGCRARTCPVPGHPCLEGLATEDVAAAAERLAGAPVPPAVPAPGRPDRGRAG